MPPQMFSNKRASMARFSLKTISAAVLSALILSSAHAAGLGRMTVLSALGQPLRAEIELTAVSKDEVGALAAKLASPDAFSKANIELNTALLSLRFNVEQRGERQFIRVTSVQPLNEPFVDMLLELTGPNGRLVREYTFLLDPPDLRTAPAAQVAPIVVPGLEADGTRTATAPVPSTATPTSRVAPSLAAPGVSQQERSTAVGSEAGISEYQVRRGDTLTSIATRIKPSGVSLDQMLVALYQSNPDAFIQKNMNRLKAGQILDLPRAEVAAGVNAREARTMIVAQAADFNDYRNRLASRVGAGVAQRSAESRQDASGRITARVEERSALAAASRDKLQLSNATAAAGASAGASVSAEDLIASQKALAEANARVKELERNVSDLQKLLELTSPSLAPQQNQTVVAAEPVAPPTVAPVAVPVAVVQSPPAASEAPSVEAPPVSVAPAPVVPAPVAAKPVPAPPPPPPPSLIDELLENPLTLPGLGALLLVLAGFGLVRARRQKKSKRFEDSVISDSSLTANSLFGSTGGQSVDTNNSVFNSGFAPSASQLDNNEVDPVAEADVYIAYGRDAQAEEILKEALRTQPERHAVRVKLLEIYSHRKDLRGFELLATELHGMTRAKGDEWLQAAAMGIAIDPGNPLYANANPGSVPAHTQLPEEQELATLQSESVQSDTSHFADSALEEQPFDAAFKKKDITPTKPAPNDLDFDLEGMNLEMDVPNTIPRPAPAEPSLELATIDFDFLDTKTDASQVEMVPEFKLDEMSKAAIASADDTSMPVLDELKFALDEVAPRQAAEATGLDFDATTHDFEIAPPAPQRERQDPPLARMELEELEPPADVSPLDFDLSGISLELDSAPPELKPLGDVGVGDNYGSTEMATKLDLAIAYQEIGDKEGARELLDEVLKGGTREQTEKAKSLLLELA
jgi:pilus assembly protein FimV